MKRIVIVFALSLSFCGYSQIVNVPALTCIADSYSDSGTPGSTAGGSTTTMKVSKTAASTFRSFVKFDLSSIPYDAVITSAILQLTPNGTENITTPNSMQLYVEMCNNPWTEGTLNHTLNISNNVVFSTVDVSNQVSGRREFQIKNYVQSIVEGYAPNNGWRIRRSDETTIASTEYHTREAITPANRPQLIIQYYLRPYVSAATIVHESSVGSANGSISPTVTNGSNTTKTYRWFNSGGTQIGTTQNLSGLTKGWYGLKYYGTTGGDTSYQAFLIGTKCENTALTFNPGINYMDDALIYNWVTGSGATLADYSQTNSGSYGYENTSNWYNSMWYRAKTLMRFKLWVDPQLTIGSANLALTGYDHYASAVPNASEMLRVTSNWSEYGVTYLSPVTNTSVNKILVPALPTGAANTNIELKPFFDIWKTNNAQNFGVLFQLQTQNATDYFRMMFYSSEAATGKPELKLSYSLVDNTCDFSTFTSLKDKLDAGYASTFNNTLKFFFTEEYTIDAGKKLPLKIYNEDNTAIAGIDFNGAAIPGLTLLPAINYLADKNFVSLSLSGVTLTSGKFYTLELTNTLGEKKYLKFKYTN